MVRNIFIAFCMSLLLLACGSGNDSTSHVFEIDNPLDRDIVFSLDNEEYTISANKTKKISLDIGIHKLVYGKVVTEFEVESFNEQSIINPTLSSYVVFSQIYVQENDTMPATVNSQIRSYKLGEERVIIPFSVVRSLFIEQKDWNWTEGLKDKVSKKDIKHLKFLEEDKIESKIFRGEDFLEYLGRENFPAGFTFVQGE